MTIPGQEVRRSRTRAVLVIASTLSLFFFAFPAVLSDLGPGPLFYYRLLIFPADLSLALTLVMAVAWGVSTRTRPRPAVGLLGLLAASLLVALLLHPSPQGVFTVARFAGVTALAYAVATLDRHERLLAVGAVAAAALLQLALAIAQIAHGGPLGLVALGEVADPLLDYVSLAPRGTMHAQQVLGWLGLIAASLLVLESFERRAWLAWSVAAGVVVAPVGLIFGRGAAVSLALALAALAPAARQAPRITLVGILCLELGAATAAVAQRDGWLNKVAHDGAGLDSRDLEWAQAFGMIASAPLTGVGPGRYVIALMERYPEPPAVVGYQPVHVLPLLAAAEGGVISGALATALIVVLGWRARRDPPALALFAIYVVAVLTEHFPYTYLQGLVLLALWVGALDGRSVARQRATERPPVSVLE